MNQKGFVIPLIITIIAILAIGGVVFVTQKKEVEAPVIINPISTTTNPIIGGDRDEHGCLGPAGYSWCEAKNKCLRVWEEKCEVAATTTNPVACTMDAMMCPDGTYVGRTGPNCKFVCPTNTVSTSTCSCPAGYIQDGNTCNPKCYYSTPKCLMPSLLCSGNKIISTSTKTSCTPNWTCGWGTCTNGYQSQFAIDANNCGVSSPGINIACPALARACVSSAVIGFHDVKYFFDNLESFNSNLPRSGITQEVIIKGKLVQKEVQVQCIKAPCNPIISSFLEDINNVNYSIQIYDANSLLSKLTVGEIYTLKGKLQKDVDFGRETVYISNFSPEEIANN